MRIQYNEPEQIGDILSRIIEQLKDKNKEEPPKEKDNDNRRT